MEHSFSDGERLTGGCHLQVTSKEHRKSKTIPLFRNGRRWGGRTLWRELEIAGSESSQQGSRVIRGLCF